FADSDPIVDPASPMMVGMPDPIPGSSASHLSFTGLPAAAHIVVITDTTGNPALYDFRPGKNCGGGGPCTLGSWNEVAGYPEILESAAICTDGTFVYGAAGNAAGLPTAGFYKYDFPTDSWSTLASVPTTQYDSRSVYDSKLNKIYLFGG